MPGRRRGWWDVHDVTWRRARALFAVAVSVVALYVIGLGAVAVAVSVSVIDGDADRLGDWAHSASLLAAIVIVVVAFAVAAVLVTALGWRGLPRRALRLSGAHRDEAPELARAARTASDFSLAYGLRPPATWVIEDDAVNALACGRPTVGNIALTRGALRLPHDELEALTASGVAALASRVFAYATSAADLVLLGEWCTRLLWSAAGLVILAVLIGVPFDVAAAYVLGIAALVLVTRPVLMLTDRAVVGLLDDASELVDLEVVRRTNQPAAMARLLLDVLEQPRRAQSRWEIVHLWFERDLVEPVGRAPMLASRMLTLGAGDLSVPAFAERCASRGRVALVRRADVMVEWADDEELRRRLGHPSV